MHIRTKLLIICILSLPALHLRAQESQPADSTSNVKKERKNYFGLRLGGAASALAHSSRQFIPLPGKQSVLSWHAGVALDMFTSKYYNARMELSYINKGGRDTFSNGRIDIETSNRFGYIQYSLLPVVIKPGFRKINPYIALGGYYARGVANKSRWKPGANAAWEEDAIGAQNLDISQDFGYSVSAGVYVWKRPLFELRYEGGLRSASALREVRNRSLVLSISI